MALHGVNMQLFAKELRWMKLRVEALLQEVSKCLDDFGKHRIVRD